MAPRTAVVHITEDGRDKGKVFLINEMPAEQLEYWAVMAWSALARTKQPVPDEIVGMGAAGLLYVGLNAFSAVPKEDLKPLMDEMMDCVEILPHPTNYEVKRKLIPGDTEEVMTRFKLRAEWANLHLGFSLADAVARWTSAVSPAQPSSNIPMSPEVSAPSSQAA